ncbi:GNAT family N-acetyltransferase [Rathayibacter sp. YIM 133350]|uniref:GNAT family N-acetyltransferase n=1 Tax=Rathayibacter sp. YIM 133350 TaxID=3131992 RepID=UPI00307CD032
MPEVTLAPWSDDDLATLRRSNAPEMMTYLGGPESEEGLVARHERYLRLWKEGTAQMYRIVIADHPEGVGSVGVWNDDHHGNGALETGWAVESAYQGHGIATAAVRTVLRLARDTRGNVEVYAYPRTSNEASNAICRKAGFELIGEESFEYPKDAWSASNIWVHRSATA